MKKDCPCCGRSHTVAELRVCLERNDPAAIRYSNHDRGWPRVWAELGRAALTRRARSA